MDNERKIHLSAVVAAIPAPNHAARYRGGPKGAKFAWTATPTPVVVVDDPQPDAAPRELSPDWWQEVLADPHLSVRTAADSGDPEVPALKAALAKAERDIARARADYLAHVEKYEARERDYGAAAQAAELKFRQMTEEIERLQAQLSAKPKKAAA